MATWLSWVLMLYASSFAARDWSTVTLSENRSRRVEAEVGDRHQLLADCLDAWAFSCLHDGVDELVELVFVNGL